jgi:hypothetical protein
MNKKWMPITAGILEILAGFWILISTFYLVGFAETPLEALEPHEFLLISILIILGVLPLIGGVFALIHRKWRLALAGAAAVIPLPFITFSVLAAVAEYDYNIPVPYTISLEVLLSISPIVLLLLSKREFK